MKIRSVLFACCLIAPVLLMADESSGSSNRSPSSDGASVSFAEPADGDIVATTFVVKFQVSGMGIAPAGSQIDNTGHHHLLIDVEELPDLSMPLPATEQIRHFGGGQSETELSLPLGEHSLQLVFADYAHVPHDPPVVSEVIVITVSDNPPEPEEAPEG
jgi:hypothetical protein